MSADRLRAEVPPVVTAIVGIVVAVVSGVFGISAHGLATTIAMGPPTAGQILLVAAASAGVGAATAAVARHRSPIATATAGLIAGQAVVHMVLSSGHAHGHHAGAAHAAGHHITDPAAVRTAMDSAAGQSVTGLDPAASAAALFTPGMLGAHLAAIVVALALVAILAGTLAWVAARVLPMAASVHLVVVAPLLSGYHADAPRARYLLARGGTRAPPVAV